MIRILTLVGALAIAGAASPHQISEGGRGAYEASLAVSGTLRAAAWYDTRDGHAQIYFRLLDADGRPSGAERRLTNGTDLAYEPDIAIVSGNFAIAWYEKNPATNRLRAKLGIFTPAGQQLNVQTLSAPDHDGRNPVVRMAGGRLFCAWLEGPAAEDPSVWAVWLDTAGRPSGPPRRLAPAGPTTWNLNAAVDQQNSVWVAFDATAATKTDELFMARIDGDTAHVTRISADDGFPSKYPDVALNGGRLALTWFDERDGNQEVYLLVAPGEQSLREVDRRAIRVTRTPGESIGAYVAWNGRQLGLAWCDNTEGQHEIYFARFDATGKPLNETMKLTATPTDSLIPAIRPWRKGFALIWNEFQPAPGGTHDPNGRSEVMFRALE